MVTVLQYSLETLCLCASFDKVYSTAMRQWVYSPCGTVLQSSLEIVCIVQYRESSTVQSRDSTFYGFYSTVLQYSFETVGLLLHMVLLQSGLETVLYSTAQKLVSRWVIG